MPIYENLVIGNFLFALGLKMGARRGDYIVPDLAVSLLQQTPLDIVLGDVKLAGPRAIALLEFKRAADRRSKEREKLDQIEALLERPKFQELRVTSRQIHFYVETKDILNESFSRVIPYLDFVTDDQGSSLEHLIDDLAFRARSAPMLPETDIKACQRYLKLVCICQGHRSYHASPGLLVGVDGGGRIAFAPVDDIRDLQTTFAAIRSQEIIVAAREQLAERVLLERERGQLTREQRLRHVQRQSLQL